MSVLEQWLPWGAQAAAKLLALVVLLAAIVYATERFRWRQ